MIAYGAIAIIAFCRGCRRVRVVHLRRNPLVFAQIMKFRVDSRVIPWYDINVTPTKGDSTMKITSKFYGRTYSIDAPYAEGHTLTAEEAEALNRYWAEQVLNIVRGRVNKDTPAEQVEAVIAEVASGYKFGQNRRGSGGDPVLKRAREIAMQVAKKPEVREALEAAGVNLKSKVEVYAGIRQLSEELADKIYETARAQIEAASELI